MKIVVDARQITAKSLETGCYMEELVKRLPVLEPSWNWHFFFSDKAVLDRVFADASLKFPPGVSAEVFAPEPRFYNAFFIKPFRLSKKLHDLHCDLYFSPDNPVSHFTTRANKYSKGHFVCVTSFQNVIRKIHSFSRTSIKTQSLQMSLKQAVRQSAAIIAPSATSRNDIITDLGLAETEKNKIRTVYNGVFDVFKANKKEFELSGPYCKTILSVTNYPFDKDTTVLLKAFSKLIRDKDFCRLRLVCIGPVNGNENYLRETAASLGCEAKVSILTGISQEDIAKVCSESLIFVDASEYEDFGQTIIDAMACGLPVICCNNGAQGEIVQDAAIKIPADDVQALTDAMKHLVTDAKARKTLSERGLRRSSEFAWDNTATSVLAIFREILAVNGDGK